uniref:Uncharacterized protein n=1 Tax=Lophocladia kuetzingii TaxID=675577 RepID=A0A1Z1MN72_9FLOR|nr:hypothetical protein [Lophocladia kuetzingii]ARW67550.1 hypothetical protein [Lophocladia kuetzingii]
MPHLISNDIILLRSNLYIDNKLILPELKSSSNNLILFRYIFGCLLS